MKLKSVFFTIFSIVILVSNCNPQDPAAGTCNAGSNEIGTWSDGCTADTANGSSSRTTMSFDGTTNIAFSEIYMANTVCSGLADAKIRGTFNYAKGTSGTTNFDSVITGINNTVTVASTGLVNATEIDLTTTSIEILYQDPQIVASLNGIMSNCSFVAGQFYTLSPACELQFYGTSFTGTTFYDKLAFEQNRLYTGSGYVTGDISGSPSNDGSIAQLRAPTILKTMDGVDAGLQYQCY